MSSMRQPGRRGAARPPGATVGVRQGAPAECRPGDATLQECPTGSEGTGAVWPYHSADAGPSPITAWCEGRAKAWWRGAVILIVGGGIGGLSLAACLARTGVDVELVERQATWTTVGGGITLYPNGMRALEAFGARDEVEANGRPLDRLRILARDGRVLAETRGEAWEGVGRTFMVDRRALQRVLVRAAEGVRVRLGTTITGITVDGDGAKVAFGDGRANRYDLVVGADGIRSTVRRLIFGPPLVRFVGQMYWRTSVTADLVDTATMMFDRDRYVVVFPLGGGSTYVAFQLRTDKP